MIIADVFCWLQARIVWKWRQGTPFTSSPREEADGERYTKTIKGEEICEERSSQILPIKSHFMHISWEEHTYASMTS